MISSVSLALPAFGSRSQEVKELRRPKSAIRTSTITFQQFCSLVGTKFYGKNLSSGGELELVGAKPHALHQDSVAERFSLIFRSPTNAKFEQTQVDLFHPNLGTQSVLIVPIISKDPKIQKYQAVFNRRLSHEARTASSISIS